MADEPDHIKRSPTGEVLPGSVLNPTGKNAGIKTGQPWKIRVQILEEKYPDIESLEKFFEPEKDVSGRILCYNQTKAFKQLPHRDSSIIQGLFDEFTGDHADRLKAREAYWDRHDGKPTQRSELSGPDGGPINISTEEAANAVRGKLLPELAAGDKGSAS